MGFLDRLLGRTKEPAGAKETVDDAAAAAKEQVGAGAEEAQETGVAAKDTASDASGAGDPPGPPAA